MDTWLWVVIAIVVVVIVVALLLRSEQLSAKRAQARLEEAQELRAHGREAERAQQEAQSRLAEADRLAPDEELAARSDGPARVADTSEDPRVSQEAAAREERTESGP